MEYKIKQPGNHVCLECGDIITYGREDRKFCSDRCKNKYHNDIAHRHRSAQIKVIRALSKNYRILDSLLMEGIYSMNLMDLAQMGYNKEYATSYQKVRGRNEYRCFDIKYCLTPTRIMKIERIELADKIRLL